MFGLCAASEDDTIFLQNEYLFGDLNRPGAPTLGRFFIVIEKFLLEYFYPKVLHLKQLLLAELGA